MTNLQNRQNADGHWRCKRCRKFRPLTDFVVTRENLPMANCQPCKEKVQRIQRRQREAAQKKTAAENQPHVIGLTEPLRPWTGGVNRQEAWRIESLIPGLEWQQGVRQ